MKAWFTRLLERYEEWRQKNQDELVLDMMKLQVECFLKDGGILVPQKEQEVKK
jgi:hypothetical protein